MKKKFNLIWIILASIDFWLLISKASVKWLCACFACGIFTGVLLAIIINATRFNLKRHPIETVCNCTLELLIVWKCSASFYSRWMPSPKVNSILGLVTTRHELLLRVISVILSVFAIPFLYVLISLMIRLIILCVKSISWKKIWKCKTCAVKSSIISSGIGLSNIIITAICGLLMMTAVYSLPLENIERNVKKSAVVMEQEGTYPLLFSWCSSQLDNYTDAIMLNEASFDTNNSAMQEALLAYRGSIDGNNPQEVLVAHYVFEEDYSGVSSYARYWHGYQVLLKPLLEIFDYSTIRSINGITQLALLLMICWLMYKKQIVHFILPYVLSYLLLMPLALAKSLQFSSCYYVFSIGVILLLILPGEKRKKFGWLVFLNVGIMTAFFDFLTYPIATFGVPAVVLLALTSEDEIELKLRHMIENGIAWCAGFGGMWASKWVLTACFTDFDILSNALHAIGGRTSAMMPDGTTKISILKCILTNLYTFLFSPASIAVVILGIILVLFLVKNKSDNIRVVRTITPYVILALAPIVWYCFATNHSAVHYWFTNKACVVTILAVLFGLVECCCSIRKDNDNVKERLE